MLFGCQDGGNTVIPNGMKDEIDSVARNIRSTDTLEVMLDEFLQEGNLEGQMVVLKHLGRLQREGNKFVDAIESHSKGAEIATTLCDTAEMIHAFNNIGTNYRRMSMLEDATVYHYKALKLCEQYSDKDSYAAKKNRVVSLNGIGNISLRTGDMQTADSVFRAALRGEAELGSALGQAINYANLGAIFDSNGQIDSAWVYYTKSLEMNTKANSDLGKSLCYGYFGGLYEKEGKYDDAIKEYEKAYFMEGKIDDWHWLNSCLALARIYIYRERGADLWTATQLLARAEQVALESRSRDQLADIYSLQHNVHEANGRWAEALASYKKSCAYRDSIISEKNLIQMQNERVQFEYERRQREIDIINGNLAKEKKLSYIITIAVIIVVILAILTICTLLYILRMRKKQQQALLQLDEMRSSFFTNITHEFRTPLTIIIGYAERLRNGTTSNGELPEIGQMITRHGKNLLSLINQILDLSKVKSCANAKEYNNGNIVGYIHTIVESMRELTRHKGHFMMFSPEKQNITMDFIPDYITKILTNLISNAIKFTPEDGHIFITADVEDKRLKIIVADNGHGIDSEELPHIFETFYQGKSETADLGSGVGLSLVKQLVEAMNGEIEIRSATGSGCVTTIYLPIKQGETEWPALGESSSSNSMIANSKTYNKPTDSVIEDDDKPVILIVEDNDDIIAYMTSIVKDCHLIYAQNGKDGLNKALTHVPDIIITDLMMPEMDGLEMCRLIRQNDLTSHIPVIVVTAKCTESDKVAGLKAGANSYIYKPFNAEELTATIESALAHRNAIRENIVRNNLDTKGKEDLSNKDLTFLHKVIDTIYAQMKIKGATNDHISSALCLSTKQLNRKIMALTGESLAKYVLKVKMTHAKKLLDSDKDYNITDIALKCGYEDHSNFTRAFKSVFGITPTQHKKDQACRNTIKDTTE